MYYHRNINVIIVFDTEAQWKYETGRNCLKFQFSGAQIKNLGIPFPRYLKKIFAKVPFILKI